MPMENVYKITLFYEPYDFFRTFQKEAEVQLTNNQWYVRIDNGKVVGYIQPSKEVQDRSDAIKNLASIFQCLITKYAFGRILFDEISFQINSINITDTNYQDSGNPAQLIFPEAIIAGEVATCSLTFDGDIIDIANKEQLIKYSGLICKFKDDLLLNYLLDMYSAADLQKDTALFFLYKGRDAISHFCKEKNIKTSEIITKKEWSSFGKITNDIPLYQSRHLNDLENLREISILELSELKAIYKKMIKNYLIFLENESYNTLHNSKLQSIAKLKKPTANI